MDLNFNKRYAYSEVYSILNWLGEDYKKKVPKNLLQLFKLERKFNYEPNIDFTKPLNDQVRQETKDIIAYLQYTCWLEDTIEKEELKAKIEENARRVKEERKRQRMAERLGSNGMDMPLTAALDQALDNLNASD